MLVDHRVSDLHPTCLSAPRMALWYWDNRKAYTVRVGKRPTTKSLSVEKQCIVIIIVLSRVYKEKIATPKLCPHQISSNSSTSTPKCRKHHITDRAALNCHPTCTSDPRSSISKPYPQAQCSTKKSRSDEIRTLPTRAESAASTGKADEAAELQQARAKLMSRMPHLLVPHRNRHLMVIMGTLGVAIVAGVAGRANL